MDYFFISRIFCPLQLKILFSYTFYYNNKIYIIIAGIPGVYSYVWNRKSNLKLFLVQNDEEDNHDSFSIRITKQKTVKLLETDEKGKIRIWDFL